MSPSKQPDKKLMKISAAAKAAGVPNQTIEYYILIGLVKPIRRPPARARYFDQELVERIRLIRKLNKTGYTLRHIREVYFRNR